MLASLASFGRLILGTLRDLAPIILVIAFFQLAVLGQPIANLDSILGGLVLVMFGLALFIQGLEMGLFPIGESMAGDLARKGSLFWLFGFAFALGFGTTVAEPALIAVAAEAARSTAEAGLIGKDEAALAEYASGLRYTVAVSVATTPFAPDEIVGVAYDAGGVTTSTVTVPLVAAFGIGLATVIRGRNLLIDGFGLIAFASLMPIVFVLIYGMVV